MSVTVIEYFISMSSLTEILLNLKILFLLLVNLCVQICVHMEMGGQYRYF